MELQQSSLYKQYIEHWGWRVLTLDGVNIFVRRIPFYGVMAKIQRPQHLPYIPKLIPFLKHHDIQRVLLEPTVDTNQKQYQEEVRSLSKFFAIHKESFLPTKTILVDLMRPEEKIFQSFTESKRRAVRRAQKNGVIVQESSSIKDFIRIKNKSAGFLGEITTSGVDKLWNIFSPKYAAILLAYHHQTNKKQNAYVTKKSLQPVGGILLIFWDSVAYYWIAGATRCGKKLFAPTLLVWEALKLSKKKKCKQFDFVGVYDERSPKQFTSWKGFTKFKEGFGGKEVYYPILSTSKQ